MNRPTQARGVMGVCAALVAAGWAVMPAAAQGVNSPAAAAEAPNPGVWTEAVTPDYPENNGGMMLRNVPAFPGITAGCQLLGTTAYATGPAWHRADNFKPLANSTINGVAWSGYYRLVNAQTAGTSGGNETFEIRILSDNAGVPGTVHAGPFTVTPTSTPDGTFGTGGPTVYDYVATLPSGVAVQGGQCYWLELRHTNPGNQRWYWYASTANPGDTVAFVTGEQDPTYSNFEQIAADHAFCLDIELDSLFANPCPIATIPAACANPDANGQPRNGATSGLSSNLPGSVTLTGGNAVASQRAEAFRLTNGGDINNVCFYAFWNAFGTAGGGAVGGGLPGNPDLQITYYNNDHPSGLLPGSVLAQYTVGQPGVTLAFDPTGIHRIDHPPVTVTANTCYYISIAYISNVNDAARHARFIWGYSNTTSANTDGFCYSRNISTSPVGDWTFWRCPPLPAACRFCSTSASRCCRVRPLRQRTQRAPMRRR